MYLIDVHLLGVHSTGVRQAYLLIQRESKEQESVVIIADNGIFHQGRTRVFVDTRRGISSTWWVGSRITPDDSDAPKAIFAQTRSPRFQHLTKGEGLDWRSFLELVKPVLGASTLPGRASIVPGEAQPVLGTP